MVDLILLKQRHEGVSVEEFKTHLLGERLELIRQLEGLRAYSASIPIEPSESLFPDESIYDSIERLQFDTIDSMQKALESEMAEEAHALGKQYIDFDEEIHIISDRSVSFKEDTL